MLKHNFLVSLWIERIAHMNAHLGETAALGTAMCWSFGSIMFTISSRRIGHIVVNRLRLVFSLALLLATHLAITGTFLPSHTTSYHIFWFSISGIVGFAAGDTLLFRSFMLVGPRIGMLMMCLAPVFGALIAWLFLNQILATTDVVAIAVTLIGICWVVLGRRTHEHELPHYSLGILCGIGGAFGQALGLVLSKKGLDTGYSTLAGNIIRISAATIIMWALAIGRRRAKPTVHAMHDKKAALTTFGGAFFGPYLGVWLSLVAVQHTYIGIAATLMALPPIFLIPLSRWFFKERITSSTLLGTIVAVAGVALIFLL
jgi:drug/metabolite transporter (DMT)-like permease